VGKCLCRLSPYFCPVKGAAITHWLEEQPDRSHFGPGEARNPPTLLGKAENIFRGETETTCSSVSVHFPVEAKLQDDVASVTSSQFYLVVPFKPGCLHVYSRGVQVPPNYFEFEPLESREYIFYCRTKWPF
jgi:hypothetical protein